MHNNTKTQYHKYKNTIPQVQRHNTASTEGHKHNNTKTQYRKYRGSIVHNNTKAQYRKYRGSQTAFTNVGLSSCCVCSRRASILFQSLVFCLFVARVDWIKHIVRLFSHILVKCPISTHFLREENPLQKFDNMVSNFLGAEECRW